MDKQYLKLYASCIPVKGYTRAIICDLHRNSYELIPNDLYELFNDDHAIDTIAVASEFSAEDTATIKEYFDFLLEKEFAFYCSEKELACFPKLSSSWHFPSIITNSIIDVDSDSSHDYKSLFDQLEELGCKHIQLRVFSNKHISYYQDIVKLFDSYSFRGLDIIAKKSIDMSENDAIVLASSNKKIRALYLHDATEDKLIQKPDKGFGLVMAMQELVSDATHCGAIHYAYFTMNFDSFTEAINYNSCLNRKLSVDADGNICNCPSMKKKYGHMSDVKLNDVTKNDSFRDVWNINKDLVKTCRDCEFRYICSDCRAYVSDSDDKYSKPAKCNYDPYTGSWT